MGRKNQDVVEYKYAPKKKDNLKIYNFIERYLKEKGKEYFMECATFNQFITSSDKKTSKLVASNPCKNRFCPICSWRKACKDAMKLSIMLEALRIEEQKEFIFLTLTTPNIKGDKVKEEITRFNKAFHKMFKRAKLTTAIKGYVRKLEMTYNSKRDDYNPHFHVLLIVNKSYFTDKRYYIPQAEWLEMWREATGLPEITQVDVRKVSDTRGNHVAEIAKYSAKSYEMATSQEVFDVFYKALKGRQLIVYGGLGKEYAAKYEAGELDKYKGKDNNEYYYMLLAKWNKDALRFDKEYRELTADEKEKYNGMQIAEIEIE